VSKAVVVTDTDECRIAEGPELTLAGRGFVPYPATPPPRPRPEAAGAEPG
jgi:hypothetical protein